MSLSSVLRHALAALWMLPALAQAQSSASPMIQLSLTDSQKWEYFSDQVMGGVSEGRASFEQHSTGAVLRLTGAVSTANNGGFIQARRKLDDRLDSAVQGVVVQVRGNNQAYYVHLRTSGTVLPWQYYQAPFQATGAWQEIRIPFASFAPSGRLLGRRIKPSSVRSLAVVAFGRDHDADLSVRAVGFY